MSDDYFDELFNFDWCGIYIQLPQGDAEALLHLLRGTPFGFDPSDDEPGVAYVRKDDGARIAVDPIRSPQSAERLELRDLERIPYQDRTASAQARLYVLRSRAWLRKTADGPDQRPRPASDPPPGSGTATTE